MVEKLDLVVYQGKDLTPLRPQNFEFTYKQEEDVEKAVMIYFKRNRISFTEDSYKRVQAIIGIDCIQRGLVLSGKNELSEKDDVSLLIRAGLESRKMVKDKAQEAIDLTRGSWTPVECSVIGPLAISQEDYRQGEKDLKNFLLTPRVSILDKLAYQYQLRKTILDQTAEFGVSILPKEIYFEASIDLFPTVDERAKLVRNMILSKIVRDTYIPTIAIEELRTIITQPRENTLEALARNILLEGLPLNSNEAKEYFDLLQNQIVDAFIKGYVMGLSYTTENEKEIMDQRDKAYTNFSHVLLLNHPALEENELVTIPPKVKSTDLTLEEDNDETALHEDYYDPKAYSLWREDLVVNIDGYLVPTLEALQRAVRISKVTGKGRERYYAARHLWMAYTRGLEKEKMATQKIEDDIVRTKELLVSFQENPLQPLPQKAYLVIFNHDLKTLNDINGKKQELKRAKHLVKNTLVKKREALNYLRELTIRYGEVPQTVPMPKMERLKKLEGDINSLRFSLVIAGDRIVDTFDEVRGNRLGQLFLPDNMVDVLYDPDNLESAKIAEEIHKFEVIKEEIERNNYSPAKHLSDNQIKDLLIELGQAISMERLKVKSKCSARKKPLEEDVEYLEGLQGLAIRKSEGPLKNRQDKKDLLRDAFLLGINRDIQKLQKLFYLKVRAENNKGKLAEKEELRVKIMEGKESENTNEYWTKDEIDNYIKEATIVIPDKGDRSFADFLPLVVELQEVFSALQNKKIGLPRKIVSKKTLSAFIQRKISSGKREVGELQKSIKTSKVGKVAEIHNKIVDRNEYLRILQTFLEKGIDNPLFPLPEGEGLPLKVFKGIMLKRIAFVKALSSIGILKREIKSREAEYEIQMRERYIHSLKERLISLNEIGTGKVEERSKETFIRNMGSLNLLLSLEQTS